MKTNEKSDCGIGFSAGKKAENDGPQPHIYTYGKKYIIQNGGSKVSAENCFQTS